MPVDSEAAKSRELWPEHEILRKIECVEGTVDVAVEFIPRFDYGRIAPPIGRSRGGIFYCEHRAGVLALCTDVPLAFDEDGLSATQRIGAGDRRYCSLTYAHGMPAVEAPLGPDADRRIERSIHGSQTNAVRQRARRPP